jgi:group II intron reverse transcriptase/maturase
MELIDKILNHTNLTKAAEQVIRNKGAAGVDNVSVKELKAYLDKNREALIRQIRQGNYYPQAIRGVEIPKSNGKKRLLGIPTVVDRMLQQAVSQHLMCQYEYMFSAYSYGFRPLRNTHQAIGRALEYINSGYQHIVDIDLKGFFDEVEHCLLLQILYRTVKCKETLRLIRRWLRVPILVNGKLEKRRKGVPQGSPLSPLLSNIMLHELDTEMERRGLKFVRYADDFSIYCQSEKEARKIGNSIYLYLKDKLRLPINREKSGIRRPVNFKILGYGFTPVFEKGAKGKYQLVAEEKRLDNLKSSMKAITRKTLPMSFDQRIAKIKEVQEGWINYFKHSSIYIKLRDLDGWLRNRLRYCIWHDWKKPERKRKNLLRLGVSPDNAYAWSRSRKGGWAIAQSPIMNTTITLERLKKRGYEPMLDYYFKVSPKYQSHPLFPDV